MGRKHGQAAVLRKSRKKSKKQNPDREDQNQNAR